MAFPFFIPRQIFTVGMQDGLRNIVAAMPQHDVRRMGGQSVIVGIDRQKDIARLERIAKIALVGRSRVPAVGIAIPDGEVAGCRAGFALDGFQVHAVR